MKRDEVLHQSQSQAARVASIIHAAPAPLARPEAARASLMWGEGLALQEGRARQNFGGNVFPYKRPLAAKATFGACPGAAKFHDGTLHDLG
ncbi:MAG: hypothetical protein ACREDA_12765, partial [Methylocella sp.]